MASKTLRRTIPKSCDFTFWISVQTTQMSHFLQRITNFFVKSHPKLDKMCSLTCRNRLCSKVFCPWRSMSRRDGLGRRSTADIAHATNGPSPSVSSDPRWVGDSRYIPLFGRRPAWFLTIKKTHFIQNVRNYTSRQRERGLQSTHHVQIQRGVIPAFLPADDGSPEKNIASQLLDNGTTKIRLNLPVKTVVSVDCSRERRGE